MARLSFRTKLLYSGIALILAFAAVEGGLHLLYALLNHRGFPFQEYSDARARVAAPGESPHDDDRMAPGNLAGLEHVEAIHPYLGFVLDPKKSQGAPNYLGFPVKDDDPFSEKSDDSVRVVVFGGSFAQGLSTETRSAMEATLRDRGINAHVLTFALGGHKQPQQLFTFAYLLSQGAQIDVAVNLDGFNEVVLPTVENVPKGVNPFYPRRWYYRTGGLDAQYTRRQMARALAARDAREHWSGLFQAIPNRSIAANIVWKARDRHLEEKLQDINLDFLQDEFPLTTRFVTTGPEIEADRDSDIYSLISEHWKSCSLLMRALADSHGIKYLHFLQPNQYFEEGKILTEDEKQKFFKEDHPYRPGVVEGYPKLLELADELVEGGVSFHDLTMIYREVGETIYHDDCCHVNYPGYQIVARFVGNAIADEFSSDTATARPRTN